MTQVTLGLDCDPGLVWATFEERDPAVLKVLVMAIEACRRAGRYVGICGQGPSARPDLADRLVAQGIESMCLNPDTVIETWLSDMSAARRPRWSASPPSRISSGSLVTGWPPTPAAGAVHLFRVQPGQVRLQLRLQTRRNCI